MTTKHEATKEAIGEAFAGWLYQNGLSVGDIIRDSAERAIENWLDTNADLIADRLAAKATQGRHGCSCSKGDA